MVDGGEVEGNREEEGDRGGGNGKEEGEVETQAPVDGFREKETEIKGEEKEKKR
jgi:hypothetical protein